MTNKEEFLLLRDLCSRQPWGCYAKVVDSPDHKDDVFDVFNIDVIKHQAVCVIPGMDTLKFKFNINQLRPILRPMDDMDAQEKEEYHRILALTELLNKPNTDLLMDFFHEHGIDYRGLIERKLAIKFEEE